MGYSRRNIAIVPAFKHPFDNTVQLNEPLNDDLALIERALRIWHAVNAPADDKVMEMVVLPVEQKLYLA